MYRLGEYAKDLQYIRSILAASLRQKRNATARCLLGCLAAFKDNARIVRQQPQRGKSYLNCAGVSRLPCSGLASLHMAAALRSKKKPYGDRKENGHVENLVFDVATALQPANFVRTSKNVLRLPHETQRFPPKCGPRQVYGCRRADVKEALNTSCSFI